MSKSFRLLCIVRNRSTKLTTLINEIWNVSGVKKTINAVWNVSGVKKTINEVWNVSGVNKTIRELWNVSGVKKTNNEVWNVSGVKKTIDLSTCLSMLMSAVDQLPPNKVTTDLIRVTSSLKTTKLVHMLLQYSFQYYYAVGLLRIRSPTNQSFSHHIPEISPTCRPVRNLLYKYTNL